MLMKNTKERKKENVWLNRKFFAINHPHLDQEPSQTSFNYSAVKSRTIKKVEKSFPESPRKKK